MFDKLPHIIGIYADPNYERTDYIEDLLDKVPEKSVVVLPVMSDLDVKIRNEIVLRLPTDRVKEIKADHIDDLAAHARTAEVELLYDHMFLNYLKFFVTDSPRRAHLYIFPYKYHDDVVSYSSRIQSMIIKAHLLKVPYTIVKEGDLDDIPENSTNDGTDPKAKSR